MVKDNKGQINCKYMKRKLEKEVICKCPYGCEFKRIEIGRQIRCVRLDDKK